MMIHRFLPVNLLATLLAVTHGIPSLYFAFPPTYYDSPERLSASYRQPAALLPNVKSQFHAQDELGQYTYGYNDGLSSKIESKSADGVTKGSYAYVDSNGIVQNVNYMADEDGFRVSATNLPSSAPVANAEQQQQQPSSAILISQQAPVYSPTFEVETIAPQSAKVNGSSDETTAAPVETNATTGDDSSDPVKSTGASSSAVENNVTDSAAVVTVESPTSEPIVLQNIDNNDDAVDDGLSAYSPLSVTRLSDPPYGRFYEAGHLPILSLGAAFPSSDYRQQLAPPSIGPIYSQYHSQDELGQYSYGYSGGPSSKAETKTLDGVTRGGYSYIDPNGIIQKVSYVSDPINGFRVSGTNLPFPSFPAYVGPYYSPIPEFRFNRIFDNDGNSKRHLDSE